VVSTTRSKDEEDSKIYGSAKHVIATVKNNVSENWQTLTMRFENCQTLA